MRSFLVLGWLMLPLLGWAYHVGPGQEKVKLDVAADWLTQASFANREADFDAAKAALLQAISILPEGRTADAYAMRLALAQNQIESQQLPEARIELEKLLAEMQADPQADESLIAQTRQTLASSQYYMTWLLRLEGAPAEEWEPEIEASRQHYRLLAEQAEQDTAPNSPAVYQQDAEAAIRLARMNLSDLQALKIPSQCSGCCSGQCKKPSRKQSQRKSDKKGSGANLGPLPDGSGS